MYAYKYITLKAYTSRVSYTHVVLALLAQNVQSMQILQSLFMQ